MITAGLTGGIATGKSTVSSFLKEAGATIIDADIIAKEAVIKNSPAWHDIIKAFGKEVLLADGEINRTYLGDIIFRDHSKKVVLNKIVHPYVSKKMFEMVEETRQSSPDSVLILDIPLLIESGTYKRFEDVILVYIPEEIQLKRLMERDSISETDAMYKIRSQMPIEEKKQHATIVIDNSESIEATKQKAIEVFNCLKDKKTKGSGLN
ncbi:MAG: dephospho-CoA kinase [Pseudomonadota bacterium]